MRCPHCKKIIEHVYVEGFIQGILTGDEELQMDHQEWTTYTCPECGEEIEGDNPHDIILACSGFTTTPITPEERERMGF